MELGLAMVFFFLKSFPRDSGIASRIEIQGDPMKKVSF